MTQYHLSPEEWSEAAFQRMAKGNGWMNSTFDHRWYIFRRLLRRLRRSSQSSDSRPLLFGAVLPEKTPDLLVEAVPSEFEANKESEAPTVDLQVATLVRQYQEEMGDLKQAFAEYLSRRPGTAQLQWDLGKLTAETRGGIFTVLRRRIDARVRHAGRTPLALYRIQ